MRVDVFFVIASSLFLQSIESDEVRKFDAHARGPGTGSICNTCSASAQRLAQCGHAAVEHSDRKPLPDKDLHLLTRVGARWPADCEALHAFLPQLQRR
jgi:hypothetical protein